MEVPLPARAVAHPGCGDSLTGPGGRARGGSSRRRSRRAQPARPPAGATLVILYTRFAGRTRR